jgi:hypothetical protein
MTIPEFPGFDPQRHVYIIATGCGDAWETPGPLETALCNDMAQAEYAGSLTDWVNDLAVWCGAERIAHWQAGSWQTPA